MADTSSDVEVATRKAFHGSMSDTAEGSDGYLPTLDALKADKNVDWPSLLSLLAEQIALAGVIAVSANAWMLAFSMLNILLTLLSNISSFSTFWTYALHTQLEGRHSPLLHPTLRKSLQTRASNIVKYSDAVDCANRTQNCCKKAFFHTGSIFPH